MARRKFGSIDKRASGRYRARYRNPEAPEQWISAPRTYESKDDAAGWLRDEEKLIEFDQWTHPDERNRKAEASAMTVKELCEKWLTESSEITKESTRQSHRRKLQARVYPYPLADMPVTSVTLGDVEEWWQSIDGAKFTVNGKAEKQPTPSTNNTAYKRLHTAFSYAVRKLKLITENPVNVDKAGTAPKPKNRDRDVISLPQARALVKVAPARMVAPVSLLLWAGLRLGELLELRRKDLIGLDGTGAITVKVRENAQRVTDSETGKQKMIVVDPKSDAGKRGIVLPASIAPLIRAHAAEHMEDGADALVVTTLAGEQMLDTNFRNRWKKIATDAGRPDITPHDCRRFFGTQLVNKSRVPLEEARRIMGHETVEMLMEYQRAGEEYEKRAADALNELLGEDGKPKVTMNTTEKMAVGWFLAINSEERKRISHMDVRCDKGCLLAAGVTIDKELHALGITDSTRTETHPRDMSETIDAITGDTRRAGLRLTAEAVDALSVEEFLQGFRAVPRAFSMRDLAAVDTGHRHGWLDPWDAVKTGETRVRARCRHLEGYIPVEAFNMDKKTQRLTKLDNIV